jgi:protocatechuate 3,4-dioxygenase beta subunit
MTDERPAATSTDTPTDLDDDDRPIGRFLSRREILVLFGAGGAALAVAACAPGTTASPAAPATPGATPGANSSAAAELPGCVAVPELTEGPYYVDTDLERSDIRPDTTTGDVAAGVPLVLKWVVSRAEGTSCVPLEGAVVDVWHCDALGEYSGVQGDSGNFLRGVQRTDAKGQASFTTVYPGWYAGRAVHIHFKIRTEPDASEGFELTSQLFFNDDLSRQIFTSREPYTQKGAQDRPNEQDQIYGQSDGTTLLPVTESGEGYAATFSIAVQTG